MSQIGTELTTEDKMKTDLAKRAEMLRLCWLSGMTSKEAAKTLMCSGFSASEPYIRSIFQGWDRMVGIV